MKIEFIRLAEACPSVCWYSQLLLSDEVLISLRLFSNPSSEHVLLRSSMLGSEALHAVSVYPDWPHRNLPGCLLVLRLKVCYHVRLVSGSFRKLLLCLQVDKTFFFQANSPRRKENHHKKWKTSYD